MDSDVARVKEVMCKAMNITKDLMGDFNLNDLQNMDTDKLTEIQEKGEEFKAEAEELMKELEDKYKDSPNEKEFEEKVTAALEDVMKGDC